MAAEVEKPILPHRLYRYRTLRVREPGARDDDVFRREMQAISHPYLWCSDFTRMNDPMEGFYRASTRLRGRDDYSRTIEQLMAKKMGVGIASLSDNRDNELMWAHYAGNYSGICVAYRTEDLVEGLPAGSSLVRLGYADRLPRVTGTGDREVRAIFSQKKGSWAYEREWRVLGPTGRVEIDRPCVTQIYLGAAIEARHKKEILREFEGTDIEISKMTVNGYEHSWSKLRK